MEYASIGARDGFHPALRAPHRIRQAIARARRQAGLPPIHGLEDRVVADPRHDPDIGPRVWADPAGQLGWLAGLPPHGGHRQAPVTYRTSVLLAAGYGLARGHGATGTCGKRIDRRAFGSPDELNASPGWSLKRDGHNGDLVAFAGPALRAVASDEVPLLVRWLPDLNRSDHRELVRRIEAGEKNVSASYIARDRRVMRLPQATDIVLRATLLHVAVLPNGVDPAFPSATAFVFRERPDTADELRAQVAAVEKAVRWRAAVADAR